MQAAVAEAVGAPGGEKHEDEGAGVGRDCDGDTLGGGQGQRSGEHTCHEICACRGFVAETLLVSAGLGSDSHTGLSVP